MVDLQTLGEVQLDALREVANIGAGHAATALSQLTDRRIVVEVPKIRFAMLPELKEGPTGSDSVATVSMQVFGDVTGRTLQVFPARTASSLSKILTRSPTARPPEEFGELERSALTEAGNIVAGAYLNALSDFMGMLLLMSVPEMRIDHSSPIGTLRKSPEGGDEVVLCMETQFRMEGEPEVLSGDFVLVPDRASLQVILEAIHVV